MLIKVIGRLLMVIVGLCVGLVVIEIGLRVLNKPHPERSGWKMVFPDATEENQLGFRGKPIEYSDDDFVIVLLGDSQVEAVACSYEWMPERRLEHYLNSTGGRVRVFTVGAGAYGQDQELLALQEYLKSYRADLVVLWETPTNDIWNNVFPTNYPTDGWPKPTFWLENGELRGPTEQLNAPIRETSRLKLELLWHRWSKVSRDKQWEKILPSTYTPISSPDGPVRDDFQSWWNTNARSMRSENLDNEKSHLAIYLTPRSDRMQYGLDLTRKLLHEIDDVTRLQGGKFAIFATDVSAKEAVQLEGLHVLKGKYYRTSAAQYQENIGYVNGGFDFMTIPVTVDPWRVGPENPHLNEHATDKMMSDLAERIKRLVPMSK
ncbi:MAG: hypothetical protein KA447_14110 [Pyrinomonadaceae bacterium]|nr:hypothetical protein [Pyrinomonadaceae bacterium]